MTEPVPLLQPDDLAERLDRGEPVQVLDVRAPHHVAVGRVQFGSGLDYRAVPGSALASPDGLAALAFDPTRPIAVVCGHGNSSRRAAALLRSHGLDAHSVAGGMARWETVYLARPLAPTATLERVVQLDRVGKGCLSYVLVSAGQAAVIDPGRHLARYEAVLDELGATPAAVIDTHMHADYVSGAAAAARRWSVPYYLHPDDARSPYDGAPGRVTHAPLSVAEPVSFGRAALQVEHRPGHTLGSVVLRVDGLAFTGDFLFVASVGRPDLGEQADAWGRLLWRSLEESRASWPGDTLVLPAHYTAETERRADRTVGARLDVIAATNPALAVQDESGFLAWLARHASPAPATYRTIKLANLGLAALSDSEIEAVEVGPNQCAVA